MLVQEPAPREGSNEVAGPWFRERVEVLGPSPGSKTHGISGLCLAGGHNRYNQPLGLATRGGTRARPEFEDTWQLGSPPHWRAKKK
jgi:hypothetical protein